MTDEELRSELKKYHDESFGWAMHCCNRHYELAVEVLQISFLKVLERKAKFNEKSQFRTWFFSVIRNTSKDVIKKRKWHGKNFKEIGGSDKFHLEDLKTEQYKDEIPLKYFSEALSTLSDRQKELMHLMFYQEMSINQAAEIMKISGGAARKHYHRAKQQLGKWFKEKKILR